MGVSYQASLVKRPSSVIDVGGGDGRVGGGVGERVGEGVEGVDMDVVVYVSVSVRVGDKLS